MQNLGTSGAGQQAKQGDWHACAAVDTAAHKSNVVMTDHWALTAQHAYKKEFAHAALTGLSVGATQQLPPCSAVQRVNPWWYTMPVNIAVNIPSRW